MKGNLTELVAVLLEAVLVAEEIGSAAAALMNAHVTILDVLDPGESIYIVPPWTFSSQDVELARFERKNLSVPRPVAGVKSHWDCSGGSVTLLRNVPRAYV